MVPHGARERHVRTLRYILRSRVENVVHFVQRLEIKLLQHYKLTTFIEHCDGIDENR